MRVATAARGLVAEGAAVFRADDEALLRGAAAFETLRVYAGRPFLLGEHAARFRASIDALGLEPVDDARLRELEAAVLTGGDGVLRLYRTSHEVVATFDDLPPGLDEQRSRGVRLRTVDLGAPTILAGVKATSYADAFAARRAAEQAGANDALFLAAGVVLETATANIWWRRGDELFTPALRAGVLPGVTRGFFLGVEEATEGVFDVSELAGADEAFTTSSVREVMPVVELDGRPVGDGRPGAAAARLQASLRLRSAP